MPLVDCGVAKFVLPGEDESGDRHLVCRSGKGILIAALDGIGHGEGAANAAEGAISILKENADEPVISLVELCHEKLRSTRGVVMSLAFIDLEHGLMTWLGVGNVQGALMRAGAQKGSIQEVLLLRGGVATDGIRVEFVEELSSREAPQRAADKILKQHSRGNDDALVLVVRLIGVRA